MKFPNTSFHLVTGASDDDDDDEGRSRREEAPAPCLPDAVTLL